MKFTYRGITYEVNTEIQETVEEDVVEPDPGALLKRLYPKSAPTPKPTEKGADSTTADAKVKPKPAATEDCQLGGLERAD